MFSLIFEWREIYMAKKKSKKDRIAHTTDKTHERRNDGWKQYCEVRSICNEFDRLANMRNLRHAPTSPEALDELEQQITDFEQAIKSKFNQLTGAEEDNLSIISREAKKMRTTLKRRHGFKGK
jgi:hypothetical protein